MAPKSPENQYFTLDPEHTDPARIKKEREKARKFRKTQAWLDQINRGVCHYCGKKFKPAELTLDHVTPLARGGASTPGNMVAACRQCNQEKQLSTPVDALFEQLKSEREKP
jgi:5-methylcytosine-specific restriction endonuclease McrA